MEKNNLPAKPKNIAPAPIVQSSPEESLPTATNIPTFNHKPIMIAITSVIILILVIAVSAFFYIKRYPSLTPLSSDAPETINEALTAVPTTAPVQVDTAGWAIYTDKQTGFSFKYPPTLVMVNSEVLDDNQLSLSVTAEKLIDIPEELPSFMGRKDALKQKALLEKGAGANFVKIGSLYGNTSFTYSMFEVCSVMFVRKLVFFPNDYRVILSLTAPEAKMIAAMPDFFQIDPTNCGNNKMWAQDKKSDFETTLANHQGQGLAQTWYDTFYGIAATVQLITPTENIVSSPTPAGSTDPIGSAAPISSGLTYIK